jgi:hypothetical protein
LSPLFRQPFPLFRLKKTASLRLEPLKHLRSPPTAFCLPGVVFILGLLMIRSQGRPGGENSL